MFRKNMFIHYIVHEIRKKKKALAQMAQYRAGDYHPTAIACAYAVAPVERETACDDSGRVSKYPLSDSHRRPIIGHTAGADATAAAY